MAKEKETITGFVICQRASKSEIVTRILEILISDEASELSVSSGIVGVIIPGVNPPVPPFALIGVVIIVGVFCEVGLFEFVVVAVAPPAVLER